MDDLAKLSATELDALLILLGEQAQEITDATTLVRQEQVARAKMAEAPVDPGTFGRQVLADAIAAAPARAVEIEAQRAAEAAAEEAAAAEAAALAAEAMAAPDPSA